MNITFLGTGTSQGVPLIGCECEVCTSGNIKDNRLRSSVFIEINQLNILIDTGPDFRQQMLKHKIKRIDAIIYTHDHRDHIGGLDDIRAFNFINNQPVPVYAEEYVINSIKESHSYIFSGNNYPGIPEITTNIINNSKFSIQSVEISPIRVMHYKLPVLGFRIGDFAYITDASSISEEEMGKLHGVKYLVLNALRKQKHMSHFNLREALEVIKILSPKKAYLTHISHKMGLHAEVEKELSKNVFLAYDGLVLNI